MYLFTYLSNAVIAKAIKYSDKLVNSAFRRDTRVTVAPLCGIID